MRIILEMLYALYNGTFDLAHRMRTANSAIDFNHVNMLLDMPSKGALLAEDPRTVFEV